MKPGPLPRRKGPSETQGRGKNGHDGINRLLFVLALLLFNVGFEIGQLLLVAAATGLIALVGRMRVQWPTWVEGIPPYVIGGTAMFWVIQRMLAF